MARTMSTFRTTIIQFRGFSGHAGQLSSCRSAMATRLHRNQKALLNLPGRLRAAREAKERELGGGATRSCAQFGGTGG